MDWPLHELSNSDDFSFHRPLQYGWCVRHTSRTPWIHQGHRHLLIALSPIKPISPQIFAYISVQLQYPISILSQNCTLWKHPIPTIMCAMVNFVIPTPPPLHDYASTSSTSKLYTISLYNLVQLAHARGQAWLSTKLSRCNQHKHDKPFFQKVSTDGRPYDASQTSMEYVHHMLSTPVRYTHTDPINFSSCFKPDLCFSSWQTETSTSPGIELSTQPLFF